MDDWRSHYLEDIRSVFGTQRSLAERAAAQLDEAQLFRSSDTGENSVAILMKHVGGNLRSRWQDPFTTDGEKPDRHRDGEFEIAPAETAAAVRAVWEDGWRVLDATLAGLTPDDFTRTLMIRRQPLTLPQALHRSLTHTAQHVGQIILLARQWTGTAWQTLSIPRGRSAEYLERPPS